MMEKRPLLGEIGSGYDIALNALKAVTRQHDGGPVTKLYQMILKALNLNKAEDLIGWAYKDISWARFACLSKLVFQAAEEGDQVALRILDDTVNILCETIELTLNKTKLDKTVIVFAGGNLTHHNSILAKLLENKINDCWNISIRSASVNKCRLDGFLLVTNHLAGSNEI